MSDGWQVGIVGATGLVGREMTRVLEERGLPVKRFVPLASPNSAGEKVEFLGEEHTVQVTSEEAFKGLDMVLMSAGSKASATYAPLAAKAGAVVIDNSSQWRMDPEVPLVVPEVNPQDLSGFRKKRIIANPNCSTIQMVVALQPLHKKWGLKRVVVSTYQAVSGAGKKGMDELAEQVQGLYNQDEAVPQVFAKQIAFNCVPQIDIFMDEGFTKEELKMLYETRKIMGVPHVSVCATCVRVPVFNGHAEAVVAEFDQPVTSEEARAIWREAPGIMLMDEPKNSIFGDRF